MENQTQLGRDAAAEVADSAIRLMSRLVQALVDKSEEVHVTSLEQEGGITIILRVPAAEVGKIVGRQGRTARSLRVLLSAMGRKTGHNLMLDIAPVEG